MPYDDSIPGWMTSDDLDVITQLANMVPANGTVVEIGSLFGRSTVAWAMTCDPSVKIYCGDIFYEQYIENHNLDTPTAPISGHMYNAWQEFQNNTRKFNNVIPMRGRAPRESNYNGGPIDILFVDALHKNPDDWEIIKYFAPYVKVGGLIAGHDYRDDFIDVKENADKLSAIYNTPIKFFTSQFPNTIWSVQVTSIVNF
jgi:hypothetical protein